MTRMSGNGTPRRRWLVGAFAAAGVVGAAIAALVAVTGGVSDADHPHGDTRPEGQAVGAATGGPAFRERSVGRPLVTSVRGGPGAVRLRVAAEVAGATDALAEVPAGAPVSLSFSFERGAAGGGGRKPTLAARIVSRDGAAGPSVPLTQPETLMFDRASGLLAAPAPAGGHGGDHAATPGLGLAQSSLKGGALAWAKTLPRDASAAELSPDGRWLVAAYPARGELGIVDVLRREIAGTIATGGAPSVLRFERGGRLWALDESGGHARAVDVPSRHVVGSVAVGDGRHAIAFDERGRRAIVTSDADTAAVIIDIATIATVASVEVPAGAVDVAFASGPQSFVLAHRDGLVSSVGPNGERAARPPHGWKGAGDAPLFAVRAAPDGRTVAVLDRAGRLVVLDASTLTERATVPAGSHPAGMELLGRFALVLDAAEPTVSWVDLGDPTRGNEIRLGGLPASSLRVTADGSEALVTGPSAQWVHRVHVMTGHPMVMGKTRNAVAANWADVAAGGLQRDGEDGVVLRTAFSAPGRYRLTLRPGTGGSAVFVLRVGRATGTRVVLARRRVDARIGERVTLRFTVHGANPTAAKVVAYGGHSGGSIRQLRAPARRTAPGRYVADLVFDDAGRYRVNLTSEEVPLPSGPAVDVRVTEAP